MSKEESRTGSGTMLSRYTLSSPLPGTRDVWMAHDQRTGREVVLKILTRSLPADKSRRDAAVRKTRSGASFFHPGVSQILDIDSDGEVLFLVLEKVPGRSIRDVALEDAPGQAAVIKWAWQLADALAAIHAHGLVHGAVNDSNVMVTDAGDVKLVGVSLKMLVDRRDRGGAELLQRNDPPHLRELAHLAPEQITGKPVDPRSDIYSFGVVFHEVMTGTLPFAAANASDLANAIVKGRTVEPLELRPGMDARLARIVVKAMTKDPWARQESARSLCDELKQLEPSILSIAARKNDGSSDTRTSAAAGDRDSVIVVAEIAYYALMEKSDPARAASLASLLQQVAGESIYLFDGVVLEGMGPQLVATLPTAEAAFRAVEHALRELAEKNALRSAAGEEIVEPRIVIHAGAITDSPPSGRGLEEARAILEQMSPGQLLATTRPIESAKLIARSVPVGESGGIRLFQPPAVFEEVATTAPAETAPAGEEEAAHARPRRKRFGLLVGTAAAAIVLITSFAAWMLMSRKGSAPPVPAVKASVAQVEIQPKLFIDLSMAGVDDETASQLARAEEAIRAALRSVEAIEMAESSTGATVQLTARATPDQTQLVPVLSRGAPRDLAPVDPRSSAQVLRAVLSELARELRFDPASITSSSDEAMESFIEAANSPPQSEERRNAIRASRRADPSFEPAARLAIDELEGDADSADRIAAAEFLLTRRSDSPEIRRRLVDWQLAAQREANALPHLAMLLGAKPDDAELIEIAAKLALHAGDEAKFTKSVERLARLRPRGSSLHAPDLLASRGRFDAAITRYYAVQQLDPENPSIALKIGRIAVLRRSLPLAESELAKLQRLDPQYGHPLLSAYIAAEKGDVAAARAALEKAEPASAKRDDFQTASAEVHALLSAHTAVLDSLARAAARNESAQYILANPLFGYLLDDPRFAKTRATLEQRRDTLRSSMQTLPL